MRTVTTNLYAFDELNDKAKETARDWWRECEANDPSWLNEYRESCKAAFEFVMSFEFVQLFKGQDNLDDLYAATEALRADPTKSCPWTGYYMDDVAIDAIIKTKSQGCDELKQVCHRIETAMATARDDEVAFAMRDENVEEMIRANGNEFTAEGIVA